MSMNAIILAGGFGTRLRSRVKDTPKPLTLIGGRPFLERQLEWLADQGVDHVVLAVHYLAEQVIDFALSRKDLSPKLTVVREDEPLGTGGAVRNVFESDIDDVYHLLMQFQSGLMGHLCVDVVARPAVRAFRLCGTKGTIEWDQSTNGVRLWTAETDGRQSFPFDTGTIEEGYIIVDEPYVLEVADFVAAIKGEKIWPNAFEEDERVLALLVRAEESMDTGARR